ncbi:nuclear transport factor 2 family protein [Arachnia propionica]|uniref:Nuclear transport factor 2 family protein n=1 Tax=Arachnia propionica TaxID=1750 RepID=A0A3P1T9Y0_9ACTN|nr:nuclear transport factor 2 family protein [Arachnia propionica]MDO5083659.1 nuclear transport factor 2 family protein [Arachnia propionica]RRD06244.1 nuclear transport factor 2 family protein [Arachnia propionica]
MSEQTPATVAENWFEALGRGDVPAAMALLDPEVVWHQPGANRFSGKHTGIAGVGNLISGMMEVSQGSFRLTVTGPSMVNGDLVAVPVRFSGERAGESMDMAGIDLLTVVGGRITEFHLFSEDAATEDRFWG